MAATSEAHPDAEKLVARIEAAQEKFGDIQAKIEAATDPAERASLFKELQVVATEFKELEAVYIHI